jgi:hypothetical protein
MWCSCRGGAQGTGPVAQVALRPAQDAQPDAPPVCMVQSRIEVSA